MTIQYLVTGREGMSNWEHTASSAITKTYSFKKIEDICEEWFDPEDIGDEQRVETILDEFNFDCIKADIDGEDDWKKKDYQAAYDEDDANLWNCVDTIVKIDSKSKATTTIYTKSWDND
jgi:hypothetical protein